ncbi:MAG: CAP domain-containing protein [Legionellaceae bacterium]|nr:CAP domain-containing protein [Legionellaceae bacterium]
MNKIVFSLLFCMGTLTSSYAATNDQKLADEILVYINQYRVQHGLSKLVMNPVLSREANQHSRDMAMHAVPFGHDGFSQRIEHLHTQIPASLSGAENVAYNYKTARIVVDGWIHSPGHRQNLMGHYDLTGIGVARDNQGKPYYTQLFLRSNNNLAGARAVRINGRSRHEHHGFRGFMG